MTPQRLLSDNYTLFVFCSVSVPCLHSIVTQLLWRSQATVAQERIQVISLGEIPVMVRIVLLQQNFTAKSNVYNVHPLETQSVSGDREGETTTVLGAIQTDS